MGLISRWLDQGGGMGNFIVIVGQPHSGKTTILCNVFKKALENDFEIITTTQVFRPPKKMHIINSASGLLGAYAKTEGNVVIAIDDAQASFDSTSMASTKASKMNQTIYLFMAKLKANFIFVAHYIEKIPKPIKECDPLVVWAVKPGLMNINGRTIKVGRSPYKFPKAFIPSWRWDIDPYNLYDQLSKVKGKSNDEIINKNKEAIIEFLGNPKESDIPKKKQVELILKILGDDLGKQRKLTQKYIAEKLGVDPGYICRIKKSIDN